MPEQLLATEDVRHRCVDALASQLVAVLHQAADVLHDGDLATLCGTVIHLSELVAGRTFDGQLTVAIHNGHIQTAVAQQTLDLSSGWAAAAAALSDEQNSCKSL